MKYTEEEVEALLDKMKAISDEYDRELDTYNRGTFKSKYGERLGQYSDKLKALNGDDFDVVDSAYDEHKNDYSDLSDDEYVDALEENIKSVIARIWPEATPEEVEEAAAEIKEEVVNEEGVESTEEDLTTSDARGKVDPNQTVAKDFSLIKKRGDNTKGSDNGWSGSPHTSGGRNGHTSDEECKEDPKKDIDAKDVVTDIVKEALPEAGKVAIEVATAKPEDVPKETKLDEAYTFSKKDPLYRMSH